MATSPSTSFRAMRWTLGLCLSLSLLLGCDSADDMEAETPQDAMIQIPAGTSVPGCETNETCFSPATLTIRAGATVTWTNDDASAHTVTSGTADNGPTGQFDSSLILGGRMFSHQFEDVGTFSYFCMLHPWQTGTVIVEE